MWLFYAFILLRPEQKFNKQTSSAFIPVNTKVHEKAITKMKTTKVSSVSYQQEHITLADPITKTTQFQEV